MMSPGKSDVSKITPPGAARPEKALEETLIFSSSQPRDGSALLDSA